MSDNTEIKYICIHTKAEARKTLMGPDLFSRVYELYFKLILILVCYVSSFKILIFFLDRGGLLEAF